MDPKDYLAKLYGSRALYRLLYEEGMSVLPPVTADDEKHWPIESTQAQVDLSRVLGVSASTVGIDLRRLENWGWLQRRRGLRVLGYRFKARVRLMADTAAEASTGVRFLVSTEVIGISPTLKEAGGEALAPPEAARGTMRQWDPADA